MELYTNCWYNRDKENKRIDRKNGKKIAIGSALISAGWASLLRYNTCQSYRVTQATFKTRNGRESVKGDENLYYPLNIHKVIRKGKGKQARKIHNLTVSDKTYTGKSIPDGFFDSLLHLKSLNKSMIQDPITIDRITSEYENIIELCKLGQPIPEIALDKTTKI